MTAREDAWRAALRLPAISNGGRPYLEVLVEAAMRQADKEQGPLLDQVTELREKVRVFEEGDHPPFTTDEWERLLGVSEQRGVRWKDYVKQAAMQMVRADEAANAVIDDAEQVEADKIVAAFEATPGGKAFIEGFIAQTQRETASTPAMPNVGNGEQASP